MTLTFLFDFLSPYAYLTSTQLGALCERHGLELELRPVLLAGLLSAHGQLGPAEIPAKRTWAFREAARRAAMAGVPFGLPSAHPFRPLLPLRAVLACPADKRAVLCERFWAEAWGGEASGGLDQPEVLIRRASEAGVDGNALVEATRDPSIKHALRRSTERAVRQGVFGVPTMMLGDELFWGYDALDLLELHLRGEDPLDADFDAKLRALPATAHR